MANKQKKRFIRHQWSESELAILRKHYPDERSVDVAARLGLNLHQIYNKAHQIGLEKSAIFKQSDLSDRVLHGKRNPKMIANQFKPGHISWNKGLKMESHPNSVRTQFKKGSRPINEMPIGSYRVVSESKGRRKVLEKKISDLPGKYTNRWKPVHRLVWEEANGPIPKGFVIRFKVSPPPLDPNLITLDILEMIPLRENRLRNSIWSVMPKELAEVAVLRGALNRKINNLRKSNE